jgi:hypothetical protein
MSQYVQPKKYYAVVLKTVQASVKLRPGTKRFFNQPEAPSFSRLHLMRMRIDGILIERVLDWADDAATPCYLEVLPEGNATFLRSTVSKSSTRSACRTWTSGCG